MFPNEQSTPFVRIGSELAAYQLTRDEKDKQEHLDSGRQDSRERTDEARRYYWLVMAILEIGLSGTEIHDLTAGQWDNEEPLVLLLTIFVLPHRHRLIAATVAGPASYFVPFPGDCRARLWHEPYSTGTTRPALSRLVFYRRIRSAQPTLLTKTANRTLAYSLVPIGDSSNSIPTPIGSLLDGTARKPRN
jgi:hypothetical protein